MPKPTLEEARSILASGDYRKIPICEELFADVRTPIEVLRILKNISDHVFMLESAEAQERWGRYTFIGFDPGTEITCRDGDLMLNGKHVGNGNPEDLIRRILADNKAPKLPDLPPLCGGLVGFFSYDYLKYSEPKLRLDALDIESFMDVDLMVFDKLVAFDHYRQKMLLILNIPAENLEQEYQNAWKELRLLKNLILTGEPVRETAGRITGEIVPLFREEEYCQMVERAKYHIHEGDIFQIVLSNRLEAPFEGSLLDTYRTLRTVNPSPYMFYFSSSDLEAAGASPETLVKLEDGVLHTFPLAGTRPRGKTPQEDRALEEELLQDPKELAEHSMLVDLGRNDLGKISRFGSVQVEASYQILRFSHVMHIGSTVRGEIREDMDALDAVRSVLPAGTLSGAPKIRACELINELENNKRGIYGGAIGYISFNGDLDTCIGIRLAYKKNGRVFVRSGAGIVADSVPEKEYRECINKAAAVMESLISAGENAADSGTGGNHDTAH